MIRSHKLRAVFPVAALLTLVTGGASGEPAAGWPAYGATPGGTHFSRASQITPDNVHQLKQVWQHRSGDIRQAELSETRMVTQSSLQVTPILFNGRLYYCSPFNTVFALDARTGEELWRYDPGVDRDSEQILPNCRGVSSWASGEQGPCEQRIVVGTLDARLIALDAATGKRCGDFGDGGEVDTSQWLSEHHPREHGITSPPAILGNRVITGSMVLDNQRTDAPGGIVHAYDVRTGELAWAWNAMPPGEAERNADGTWHYATTNVWSIISVDAERDLVFLPTGNTQPDYYGGHRDGLDYYSSSVVALRGATGEVVWHYQMVHHDIWDYDTPAQPTLVDLEVNGERVPAVVQVTKMGMTFALHRETGKPLWPVEERPVPQDGAVPGEVLAATQPFPTHIPYTLNPPLDEADAWGLMIWDEAACRSKLGELRNDGIYTPPSLEGSINYPSNGGGNNWGSPAINPDTGVMVVYTMRVAASTTLIPRDQCEGNLQQMAGTPYCVETGFVSSPLGVPCTEPPWGTLDAIDIDEGRYLWSVPLGTTRNMAPFPFWWIKGLPGFAAPMMTATGLVFTGISNEHAFRAFDAATGEELWKTALPTAANALPMTYQLDEGGRQYVVVAAGGHWSGGSPPGDYLIAFALPDSED